MPRRILVDQMRMCNADATMMNVISHGSLHLRSRQDTISTRSLLSIKDPGTFYDGYTAFLYRSTRFKATTSSRRYMKWPGMSKKPGEAFMMKVYMKPAH